MKIGTMISDITASLFKRPVTEKYPLVRYPVPERLRGHLRWDPEKCTGCGLCVMDCPANAIEMIVIDKKAKRFVMRYHVDRCTFCAQCVFSCRQGCLEMSNDTWELAALNKEPFNVFFGDKDDIECVLAGSTAQDT
ncbi:MAG: 4Fe-4S binding protein [Chloroflexota bacterium]|nr:4Fe-4S binding protein [Chloroflexota bacterium]